MGAPRPRNVQPEYTKAIVDARSGYEAAMASARWRKSQALREIARDRRLMEAELSAREKAAIDTFKAEQEAAFKTENASIKKALALRRSIQSPNQKGIQNGLLHCGGIGDGEAPSGEAPKRQG